MKLHLKMLTDPVRRFLLFLMPAGMTPRVPAARAIEGEITDDGRVVLP